MAGAGINPTNWPNPERPGVPLFPERDGWHWLSYGPNQEPVPFEWSSEEFSDAPTEWGWGTDDGPKGASEMSRYFCYHGPCLTHAQIAEMLAAERERCCDVVANCAPGNFHELPERDASILTNMAEDICEAIRNLGAAP